MDASKVVPFGKSRVPPGVKAIVVILAMTAVALVADHAYFVAPHAQASVAAAESQSPVTVQVDGFALPDSLRPTAADVGAPPPSF
jgi:hypothetical protein